MSFIHLFHLDYLFVFFQSMGLELLFIIFYFCLRSLNLRNVPTTVLFTNACTHTTVIFILMRLGNYLESVLISEIFAFGAEAFIYKNTFLADKSWREAFLVSLLANLISWQLGPWFTLLWS